MRIAFLSGEDKSEGGPFVERYGGASQVIYQAKDKEACIRGIARMLNVSLSELCYLADTRRDIPALKLVGLALCPTDGDRLEK